MPLVRFTIYNRYDAALYPLTGYSLPFEIFKYIADFSSVSNDISDKKVVWDFGDGTTSTDLTGSHYYKYPGTYPVTLTVFNSSGYTSVSTVVSSITISNLINDAIILTTNSDLELRSGNISKPIYLTRYNSWQTSVTGSNVFINLAVSGNRSPYYSSDEYYSDPYSHLIPSSKFVINTPEGLTIVDKVSTTNTPIYAAMSGTSIVMSMSATATNYFAGTSGAATFYYVEDYKI